MPAEPRHQTTIEGSKANPGAGRTLGSASRVTVLCRHVSTTKKQRNYRSLCLALLACEDFPAMEHLCAVLPDEDTMLLRLGARFQAAGLVQQAVDAFCKARSACTLLSAVKKTVHAQL